MARSDRWHFSLACSAATADVASIAKTSFRLVKKLAREHRWSRKSVWDSTILASLPRWRTTLPKRPKPSTHRQPKPRCCSPLTASRWAWPTIATTKSNSESRAVWWLTLAVRWIGIWFRSGPPSQPWLEPDVLDAIAEMDDAKKLESLVILPIGFVSDHMEVLFDLDEEAAQLCQERGIKMARASSAGTHPNFVEMICGLVQERLGKSNEKPALGELGPWHDVCPQDCCLYTPRRPPTAGGRPVQAN